MLKTPVFWVLYLCMVLVASGGLMAAAEVAPIAKDYGVATRSRSATSGATLPLLTVALSIDSLVNGLTRPLTGWISDHLGRENTMVLVFAVEGLAIWGLMKFGHCAAGFLIFAPLIFLGYGEIFSLFPAVSGDTFGPKYAAANNGFLYTAKGTSSLLIPLANVLKASAGSWVPVLWIAGALPIFAAVLAKLRAVADAPADARPSGCRRAGSEGRADGIVAGQRDFPRKGGRCRLHRHAPLENRREHRAVEITARDDGADLGLRVAPG